MPSYGAIRVIGVTPHVYYSHNVLLPDLALLNGVSTQCQLLALEHNRFRVISCLVWE